MIRDDVPAGGGTAISFYTKAPPVQDGRQATRAVRLYNTPRTARSTQPQGARMSTPTADIGLIGLAVMGENLVLNMESRGYTVAVFNRTTSRVDDFVKGRAKGKNIIGTHSLAELVGQLKKPRKVMLMVQAGAAV